MTMADKLTINVRDAVGNDSRRGFTAGFNCEALSPAHLGPDGMPLAVDKGQRIDGFLMVRRIGNGMTSTLKRYFIPWSNITEVQYEPEVKK